MNLSKILLFTLLGAAASRALSKGCERGCARSVSRTASVAERDISTGIAGRALSRALIINAKGDIEETTNYDNKQIANVLSNDNAKEYFSNGMKVLDDIDGQESKDSILIDSVYKSCYKIWSVLSSEEPQFFKNRYEKKEDSLNNGYERFERLKIAQSTKNDPELMNELVGEIVKIKLPSSGIITKELKKIKTEKLKKSLFQRFMAKDLFFPYHHEICQKIIEYYEK
jgi:L-2-hydroxyglutarate oxidase LhgO